MRWACHQGEGASDSSSLSRLPPHKGLQPGERKTLLGQGAGKGASLLLAPGARQRTHICALRRALPAPSRPPTDDAQPMAPRKRAQGSLPESQGMQGKPFRGS